MNSSLPEKHSRPPYDRMLKIHGQLADQAYPNCTKLAAELSTSTKTILRDVEFMRDRYNLPIEFDSTKNGYYYTEDVASFPAITVTEGELVALLIAQKAVEQYRGTPLEKTLSAAFEKITCQLKDVITFDATDISAGVSFRSVGTTVTEVKTFEAIARGLRLRRAVVLEYQKLGAEKPEQRLVYPYHLACIQNCWYLIAHDPQKNDIRKFALPRVKLVKPQDLKFIRPADFSADQYFGESFGVFTGGEKITVKVQFDQFAAGLVRERVWHRSQELKAVKGGRLLMTMQVTRLEEVQTWVLGWGEHARVIEPKSLADEIRRIAKVVARQ